MDPTRIGKLVQVITTAILVLEPMLRFEIVAVLGNREVCVMEVVGMLHLFCDRVVVSLSYHSRNPA